MMQCHIMFLSDQRGLSLCIFTGSPLSTLNNLTHCFTA
jgi:hypothetical protein